MKAIQTLKRFWDTVSSYLPVLLMLIFAMFTYWLLQVTPKAIKKEVVLPRAHIEDYFMKGFAVTTYEPDGDIKAHILGRYARHFADTDNLEIEGPHLYGQSMSNTKSLQKSDAVANVAISNADATQIELKGNVELVKQDWSTTKSSPITLRIKSEYLQINSDLERVYSNLPVEITRGLQTISADSMEYDNLERHMHLSGNVKVVFGKK